MTSALGNMSPICMAQSPVPVATSRIALGWTASRGARNNLPPNNLTSASFWMARRSLSGRSLGKAYAARRTRQNAQVLSRRGKEEGCGSEPARTALSVRMISSAELLGIVFHTGRERLGLFLAGDGFRCVELSAAFQTWRHLHGPSTGLQNQQLVKLGTSGWNQQDRTAAHTHVGVVGGTAVLGVRPRRAHVQGRARLRKGGWHVVARPICKCIFCRRRLTGHEQ